MSFTAKDLETIAGNALAAGRELHPQPLVTQPRLRTSAEDDVAEPVTRAFVFERGGQALWLGLTAFACGLHSGSVEDAAQRALQRLSEDLWAVASRGRASEASLDERAAAVAPGPSRTVVTVVLDVKLAQLMGTSLGVLDVVRLG